MHVELTRFPDEELTDAEPADESDVEDDSSDSSDDEMNKSGEPPKILCDCAEKLTREEREFVVFNGKCEHWVNGTYKPPVKLQHLMHEREKKGVEATSKHLVPQVRNEN
jgi:hypothetical protein